MKVRIFDASGHLIRVLQETRIAQPVVDFQMSASLLKADGKALLRIWQDSGFAAAWDGRNENHKLVASGQYFVQTTSQDRLNNRTVVTKLVTVERTASALLDQVQLAPNPARDRIQLWAIPTSAGVRVNARVYTLAGEWVAELEFASADVLTWDLTNRRGEHLAAGIYFVLVIAQDPDTGLQERRMIKLAVLR